MNRKQIPPSTQSRLQVVLLSMLATLAASPAAAATNDVEIPAVPLQSGTPYPAPNVMFILDDSGSMEYVAMPEERSSLNTNIYDKSYVHNTIYYNPAIEYKAWRKADGSRYTSGMELEDVWGDANLLSDHDDISNQTHTYYVPKTGITDYDDSEQYDRYEIRSVWNDGVYGPRVIKYSARIVVLEKDDLSSSGSLEFTVSGVPAGVTLNVRTTGGGGGWFTGSSDLRVRRSDSGNWGWSDAEGWFGDSNDSVEISNANAGSYVVRLDAVGLFDRTFSGVRLVVSYGGNSGSFTTPVEGRSEADELKNFATWWSYHRTRMKVAKYAASEAFYQLGDNYRVGFDSIWNRRQGVVPNGPTINGGPAYPIPTTVDGGLFKGANRETWFKFLHEAEGNGGTPLHDALWRAGQYFSSDAPWDSGGGDVVSCRLNFAILTTDGYWNSRSRSDYGGNADGTAGDSIPLPAGVPGVPYQYVPERPFMDNRSNTLADVAMHYWKRDLRTDLTNNVPMSAADRAYWQHMVTFGVSIGKAGELDPVADLADLKSGSKEWPDPKLSNNDGDAAFASRIDDLFHATLNGHGEFVSATNPQRFVDGLLAALTTISERPGSASNVTANSTSFTNDTRVYQASYTSGTWTGELTSYVATSAGVQADPAWQASQEFPDDYTDRNIWTWDAAASDGARFPTDAQVTALDQGSRAGSAVSGADNAAYIAGDRSNELINDGNLRTRSTLLGDIVDSSPIFVSDSGALFVGANDGMLHAFDSATGEELFAYVPGGLDFANLATLSDPRYGQTVTHKYFVDGPITVSAKSQTPGKNYLVGSLGRGGRGVFGLDVTTPASFDAGDVLWEVSDDSDMGMVIGDPLVVTLNDTAQTRAVVVGNGINSPDGSATLFVIRLSDGEVLAEIEADAGSANGLSAPRGWDDNGDGRVDYLYAGDLEGNLWKFDFTGATKGSWEVANSGSPMFQARDANNQPQPITAGLALARNPDTGDVWVLLGTGRFLSAGDLATTSVQSLYGIQDDGIVDGRTSTVNHGDLIERNILKVSDDKRSRAFEPWKGSLEPGKKGWFLDLDAPYAGERVVSGLRVLGTTVIASSIVPLAGGDSCSAGGTGYINALDVFTGTATEKVFFDINGDGVVNDADRITVIVDGEEVQVPAGSIDLGIGMPTRPTVIDKLLVVGGSTGQLGSVNINPQGTGARRVSWREIVEY